MFLVCTFYSNYYIYFFKIKFVKEVRPDAFIELLLGDIENKKTNVSEVIQLLQVRGFALFLIFKSNLI